jgi:hypothetical protein
VKIKISNKDLLNAEKAVRRKVYRTPSGFAFTDKTKYSRKKKHKGSPES